VPKNIFLGYAYANGIVVLAEGLHLFRLGAIATTSICIILSASLNLFKEDFILFMT
jgi:hypothetical protein